MDSLVKSPEVIELEPEPEQLKGLGEVEKIALLDNDSNNHVPSDQVLVSEEEAEEVKEVEEVSLKEEDKLPEEVEDQTEAANEEDNEEENDSPITGIEIETNPEQFKTFVIIVNNDGSLTFDPTGVMQQDADADTLFPITLPVGMLKDPNNPIPGAIPLNRGRRKTKLQPTAFLEDDEPLIIQDPRVPAPAPGPSQNPPIDVSDISAHLNPQDIEAIENVLQSAQARGILENLDLSASAAKEGETGWDHSYTQKKGTTVKGKAKPPAQTVTERRNSATTAAATVTTTLVAKVPIPSVTPKIPVVTPKPRTTSESNNTRRSQRQQDRIERQEAERIMAENQQMLQREKEIIQSGGVILPIATVAQPPQVQDQPPIKVTVVQANVDVISVEMPSPSLDSEEIDSKRPYPKRERKLPALLADPNYVSTDEETRNFIQDQNPDQVEEEEKEVIDDENTEDETINEDDPNRLWCICRQPHNNRFMICCDECEDWFHGKCVGVTKAQGKAIEVANAKWYCPPCKVKKKIKKTPDLATLRRMSALEKEKAAAAAAAKKNPSLTRTTETPKAAPKTIVKTEKRKDSLDTQTPNMCMVCGKPARPESGYCSSECIIKFSQNTQNSNARGSGGAKGGNFATPLPPAPKTPTTPTTPATPTGANKPIIKRQNSKTDKDKEGESSFLTFHVITPGAKKSTVTVPQKQKEAAAANAKKAQDAAKKNSSARSSTGQPKTPSESPTKSSEKGKSRERKDSKTKKSPPEKEKNESWRVTDSEGLVRDNMRKMMTEILKNRVKDLTAEDKKLFPAENTPELLGCKIEEELTTFYGGASNPKCKAKYRSIFFNLKDTKNFLFLEIIKGNITPKSLVKMETEQMATAELAQWRNQENAKELEMIKRAEIEKLAEAKKQELLDAGEEIEKVVKVEAHTRSLDITDVITKADEVSHKSEEKPTEEKKHHDKDKKDSKDRNRGSSKKHEHSKDRKDHHRHRSSDSKSKDKERSRDHDRSRRRSDRDKEKTKTEIKVESAKKESTKKPHIKFAEDQISTQPTTSKTETNKKLEMRHSTDSEQELPSSTIKTPDFVADQIQSPNTEQRALFKTELQMAELGKFSANVFDCSHSGLQGKIFPTSPVAIVGRINPDTVWDYIDKMKKTKEVIVFRLAPSTQADAKVYQEFFTYLLSRGRFGVLGGNKHPIKDVYLIPQEKHSPVNRALLPFTGPGLPTDRTHCLLAVVTRQHVIGQVKRKHPALEVVAGKKRPRISGDIKAGAISALSASKTKLPIVTEGKKDDVDDDAPYAPWDEEEDEGKEEIKDSKKAKMLLEDLNARIEREKKELEVMKNMFEIQNEPTGMEIPGLDGIFDKQPPRGVSPALSESLIADEENLPFFLRQPEIETKEVKEEPFSSPVLVEEETKTELDDEVYSPSAMNFSDEEQEQDKKIEIVSSPIVSKMDEEPLPPGVEPELSPSKFLPSVTKIVEKHPCIDLEPELPTPRESVFSPPVELEAPSAKNPFEGFPRLPSIQQAPPKMKINISLNSLPPGGPIPLPVTPIIPSPKKEEVNILSVNVNVPPPPLSAASITPMPQMPVLMPALNINTNVPPPNLMPMTTTPMLPALRGIPPGPIRYPPPPLAAGGVVPFVNVRAPPPSLVPIHHPPGLQPQGIPRTNLRMPKLRQLEPMAVSSSSGSAWVDGSGAERKVGPPQLSPSPGAKDSRDKSQNRPFEERFAQRGRSSGRNMRGRGYGQRDSRPYRSRSRSPRRSRSPSREKRRRRYSRSRSKSRSPASRSRRRSMRKSRSRSPQSSTSTRRRRSSSYDRRRRRSRSRSRSRSIPVRRPKESPSRSRSPSIPKALESLEPQEQQLNTNEEVQK